MTALTDSRTQVRVALMALLVVTAGAALLVSPVVHSLWVHWGTSIALVSGALTLLVTGENAWDRMLASAQAAGLVAPH